MGDLIIWIFGLFLPVRQAGDYLGVFRLHRVGYGGQAVGVPLMKNLLVITAFITGISVFCYSGELPDTGQTTSYTETFGEDSDYQPSAAQMSYTDNGDGTVTDNRTGLMWLKDANNYNSGALQTWEEALSGCESFSYVGYSDWRLPNRRELFSIVKFEGSAPFIDTTYFLNTSSYYYWTSTTFVPNTTRALVVVFSNGTVCTGFKPYAYYVRPVRGGP